MSRVASENSLDERKCALREEILARRDALPEGIRQQASRSITDQLLTHADFSLARTLLAYASIESEVQTDAVLGNVLQMGKRLVLPRVNRALRRLDLFEVTDLSLDLQPGTWGIREPLADRCLPILDTRQIDMVLVPGVAFTVHGERLGYGGGFYDKLLADWQGGRCFIAAAFDEQLVDVLPTSARDVKMDFVVTPTQLLRCTSQTKNV